MLSNYAIIVVRCMSDVVIAIGDGKVKVWQRLGGADGSAVSGDHGSAAAMQFKLTATLTGDSGYDRVNAVAISYDGCTIASG